MEGTLKILFVEDVKTDAELIWRELEKNNLVFERLLVETKKDFIEGLKGFVPDLIISDYSLPQFDGMGALVIRNELAPFIPFILVTGSINEEVAVECMKAGANDYVLKDNLSRLWPAVFSSINNIRLLKEKKAVGDELRNSESRLKNAQSIAQIGNWELDLSKKTIIGSVEALRIYGFDINVPEIPLALIQQSPLPEFRPILDEAMDRLLKYNEPYEAEFKIKQADSGNIRYVYSKAELVKVEEDSDKVKIIGVIQDISSRKLVEEALKQSELRFKQISENSGEWIWEVDMKGMYTYTSPIVKSILGYDPEEIINKKYFYDFFVPEVRDQLKIGALNAFAKKEFFRNFINPNLHKDGRIIILSTSGLPLLDDDGNLIGYRGVDTDITERKRSEEALIESEMKYRQLVTRSPDGIFIVDLNGKFLSANRTICENLKYSEEELLGMKILDIVPEKYHSLNKQRLMALMNGESMNTGAEYEVIGRDGVAHPVEVLSVPYYKGKEIIGFQGIARDITARNLAEKELRKSEERFRHISSTISDISYSCKLDQSGSTSIDWITGATNLITGFTIEEITSMGCWGKLVIDEDMDSFRQNVSGLTPGSTGSCELRLRKKDGGIIWVASFAECVTEPELSGCKILYGGLVDITLRKQAEETIFQERNMLRTLIDNLPDIIFVKDIVCRKVIANIEDVTNIGYEREEDVIGKTDLELFPGKTGERGYADDLMVINSGKAMVDHKEDFVDDMGNRRWLLITKIPLRDKDGKIIGLVGIGHDITQRKKVEEELINAKDKAEESDRLKTAFLHNISHEIRTPMNAIVGFSALLGEPDNDEQTHKSYIEMIMQGSNHLLSIITDIVDISNIEANLVKIAKNEINLNASLQSLCKQFFPIADQKKTKLFCETLVSDSDALILTDSTKLTQILSNLVSNAIKFTDKGDIKVICRKKDNFLEFSVSDTGIGIPVKYHERIFDRFYQVQNTVSRLYEGTGLGLAISKAYVELLGGQIWLSSEPGKGTTFCFTIPWVKQIVESRPVIEKLAPLEFAFPENKKILVAEDIDSNFRLITYFFKGTNAVIIRAVNGIEAVEKAFSEKNIDLILMDIKMPEMDGYSAVKKIREANITIPIIAQTAYADDKEKAIEIGCSGFITKPFDKKGLLKVVCEFI